jgi:hypothetical protein
MVRVDAVTNPAEMVNLQTVRDRMAVGKTMCEHRAGAVPADAVAVSVASRCPQPTVVGLIDLRPETFLRGHFPPNAMKRFQIAVSLIRCHPNPSARIARICLRNLAFSSAATCAANVLPWMYV